MTLRQSAYLIYLVDWAGPDRAWESEARCLVSQVFRRVFFSQMGLDFRLLASFLSWVFCYCGWTFFGTVALWFDGVC